MALSRLVVVEGPDVGAEFTIPPGGGGIGRGEGNVVQLSDLSVSRSHCQIEARDGQFFVTDAGSRNRTLVNGRPIQADRPLAPGDEITVGRTRLMYLPPEPAAAPPPPSAACARVTLEIAGAELLRSRSTPRSFGVPALTRARQHLGALSRLGDGLRRAADRGAAARIACETVREALGAERAILFFRDAVARLSPLSAAGASPEDFARLPLSRDVLDKVLREGKAVQIDAVGPNRIAVCAPLGGGDGSEARGLFFADAPASGASWEPSDLEFCACVGHLTLAALESLAAREALDRENQSLLAELGGPREFVGNGPAARALFAFVAKVGPTDSTVLLLGESGAGKEMVAAAIHRASRRARGPFIGVNCAALTETLLESELFGHEKGAFTGATERKLGRFELADGGTLFLDEVGELTPKAQSKLLRVLEERTFERVGGTRPISVDVRLVAATHRNLEEMMRRGEFREDLYYRLSVIQAEVPPLRARPEDIPLLAEHFLARFRQQVGRRVTGFSPEALRAMTAYPWPGNVRELKNAVERAVVLGEGELVRLHDLPPAVAATVASSVRPTSPGAFPVPEIPIAPSPPVPTASGRTPTPPAGLPTVGPIPPRTPGSPKSLRELEKEGILCALAATGGNKAQAAAILEIDRSTLYKKLKEYGIDT